MMNSEIQRETLMLLRAYAQRILIFEPLDIKPSTAKEIFNLIRRMHDLKDRLDLVP